MGNEDTLGILTRILTLVGALNWGLLGTARFDLVRYIFGKNTVGSRIVYTLVGLSGAYLLGDTVKRLRAPQPEEHIIFSQSDQ